MSQFNHTTWFAQITDALHVKLLAQAGYGDYLATALEEFYTTRWRYRDSPEMIAFMAPLKHVRLDLTGPGSLLPGDPLVDVPLATLKGDQTSLLSLQKEAAVEGKPLIVFAGSYT